jgi:predicted nucleotidyltransferase
MSVVCISIVDKPYLQTLAQLAKTLNSACHEFDTHYYLIGAKVMEIWLIANNLPTYRTTNDADLVIYVTTADNYHEFRQYLIEHCSFTATTITQRLNFAAVNPPLAVDIIPYSHLPQPYQLNLNDREQTTISTLGLGEVANHRSQLTFEGLQEPITLPIVSIESIVLLKLIAWHERPENRPNDIPDIARILQHYFEIATEVIYDDHNDLFVDNCQLPMIAARVLGRQIGYIVQPSEYLKNKVIEVISTELAKNTDSHLLQQLIIDNENETLNEKHTLINELLLGIHDTTLC